MVSKYASTCNELESELVIKDGIPYIMNESGIFVPNQPVILTHNPYNISELSGWASVHDSLEKDISVGMYGNIHDDDARDKLKILENIARNMDEDISYEQVTDGDNYYASLNSNRKTKRLVKTLSR